MVTEATPVETTTSRDTYRVRRYEASDREGVIALDDAVWNRGRTPEWFAWKYEANPYFSRPPVYVVENEGEIVGARPMLGLELRVGDATYRSLQPADTMVHPDHRGRGLFTRMTARAIEEYADRDPALCFNFPNQQARPGYGKLGWREVGPRPTYYRIQNPEPMLSAAGHPVLARYLGNLSERVVQGYNAAHDSAVDRSDRTTITRRPGVPVEPLSELYRRQIPDRIHAVRSERFYRWRFDSPAWSRATYVATRADEPVAAAVARTRTTHEGITVTQLADVVPLEGGPCWSTAVAELLDRFVDDHRRSDLLSVAQSPLDHDLLASRGFRHDRQLPLSRFTAHDRRTMVRPLSSVEPRSWRLDGVDLADESNWLVTFAERDTA